MHVASPSGAGSQTGRQGARPRRVDHTKFKQSFNITPEVVRQYWTVVPHCTYCVHMQNIPAAQVFLQVIGVMSRRIDLVPEVGYPVIQTSV
jgi:hypothetical protein